MSRAWRYVLPCYLWTLPMTLAGIVIAKLVYRCTQWQWRDGVLTAIGGTFPSGETRIWGHPDAQTLGWLQMFATSEMRDEADLRVHETVHVVQAFVGALAGLVLVPLVFVALGWSIGWALILSGFIGGLGFSAVYGLCFLVLFLQQRRGWFEAYRANPFEVQAYAAQDRFIADQNSGKHQTPWGA